MEKISFYFGRIAKKVILRIMDKVYIIIVNYNGFTVTCECIDSLLKIYNTNFHIVLVDNCSTDNSFIKFKERFINNEKVDVIKTPVNSGFAGGNNYGISYAIEKGAKLYLLLNNDTEVEPDFLDALLNGYADDTICTPRINYYYDKEIVWYSAGEVDFNKGIVKNGNPLLEKKVTFASGCCMLLSNKVIDIIGMLDESYFMYYEDLAYSLDAVNSGIDIVYKPNSIIYHKVGLTTGGEKSKLSIYYNNRNRFYILKRYKFGLRCYVYTYLSRMVRFIKGCVKRDNDTVILEAYIDYKKGIIGKKDF